MYLKNQTLLRFQITSKTWININTFWHRKSPKSRSSVFTYSTCGISWNMYQLRLFPWKRFTVDQLTLLVMANDFRFCKFTTDYQRWGDKQLEVTISQQSQMFSYSSRKSIDTKGISSCAESSTFVMGQKSWFGCSISTGFSQSKDKFRGYKAKKLMKELWKKQWLRNTWNV